MRAKYLDPKQLAVTIEIYVERPSLRRNLAAYSLRYLSIANRIDKVYVCGVRDLITFYSHGYPVHW